MHAERDIVMSCPIPVLPPVLCLNELTYRPTLPPHFFDYLVGALFYFFLNIAAVTKSRGLMRMLQLSLFVSERYEL